mgnify:CR=1 FL=1
MKIPDPEDLIFAPIDLIVNGIKFLFGIKDIQMKPPVKYEITDIVSISPKMIQWTCPYCDKKNNSRKSSLIYKCRHCKLEYY